MAHPQWEMGTYQDPVGLDELFAVFNRCASAQYLVRQLYLCFNFEGLGCRFEGFECGSLCILRNDRCSH